jgi:FtsZ-binding cell division protein ZapB
LFQLRFKFLCSDQLPPSPPSQGLAPAGVKVKCETSQNPEYGCVPDSDSAKAGPGSNWSPAKKEGYSMTSQKAWAKLAAAVMMSLSLTACKDTKTLQENEQLKSQVAELQKENGQLGNSLETVTASRDSLARENEALKSAMKPRQTKSSAKKVSSRKRRRR